MESTSPRRRAVLSIVAGAIGIPAVALATSALVQPTPEPAEATAGSVAAVPVGIAAPEVADVPATPDTTQGTVPATAGRAQYRRACGPDGRALASKEAAGTITPVEQAGLDALRPVCAERGSPLPAPPTVTAAAPVVAAAPAASTGPGGGASSDDSSDDDHGRHGRDDSHDDGRDDDHGHHGDDDEADDDSDDDHGRHGHDDPDDDDRDDH